jgi:AcrR family transcriptional regulator
VDTKDQIISAAAQVFARDGYEAASLREILRDAGVNPASAHYHFGSKEVLYRRTVERWIVPLTGARARLLDELLARPMSPEARISALIEAYISPYLRLCGDVSAHPYLVMVARFTYEPPPVVQPIYDDIVSPTRTRYVDALAAALPPVDLDLVQRLFGWMVNTMCGAPFDRNYVSMTGRSAVPEDPNLMIRQITLMCSAGIQAVAKDAAADN